METSTILNRDSDSLTSSGSECDEEESVQPPSTPQVTKPSADLVLDSTVLCSLCGLVVPKSTSVRVLRSDRKSWKCLHCHKQSFKAELYWENNETNSAVILKDLATIRKSNGLLGMQSSALLTAIDVKTLDIEKLKIARRNKPISGKIAKEAERQTTITTSAAALKEKIQRTIEDIEARRTEMQLKAREEAELASGEVEPLYREVQKLERRAVKRNSLLRRSIPQSNAHDLLCADCLVRLSNHPSHRETKVTCMTNTSCSSQCRVM